MTLSPLRSNIAIRSRLFALLMPLLLLTPLACGPKTGTPPDNTGGGNSGGGNGNAGTDQSYKQSRHLALGNPTGANPNDPNNFLIIRDQYAMSYNDDAGHPNWVSWNLRASDLGSIERGQFTPDTSLPQGFKVITPRDYTRSGYDRGHLCPSADRTATVEDNNATFLMTNIIPQAPGNNQGPWKLLEDESRDMTRSGLQLCIVAGGADDKRSIGKGKVKVPAATWKIIAVLPEGKQAPRDISEATRIIAIRIPNISTVRKKDWREFRVSPKEIEDETGYKFFTTVPAKVRDALLNRVDTQ